MKNKIHIYLYILSLFSILSCEKTVYNRHLQGRVIDETTGLPIPGAWVELNAEKSSFLGPSSYTTDGETNTDNDGRFEISYRKIRNGYYKVYAGAQDYFFSPFSDYVKVDFDKRKNLEIKLTPKAVLVFDIRNSLGGRSVYFTTRHIRTNQVVFGTGQGTFSIFPIEIEGNKMITIYYQIQSTNGVRTDHDTSIFCPPFKSTKFTINY